LAYVVEQQGTLVGYLSENAAAMLRVAGGHGHNHGLGMTQMPSNAAKFS
jgi:hypothetical protein